MSTAPLAQPSREAVDTLSVACVQMVSGSQWPANRDTAQALIDQAASQGAELVLLPEYFCLLGQRDTDKLAVCETPGQGPIQDWCAQQAARHGLWLAAGTLPLACADPQRVRNSLLLFGPDGAVAARYDKLHLFGFDNGREQFNEARTIEPGPAHAQVATLTARTGATWQLGLSICYDLRFAELYRAQAAQGADVLLVPSAFTHTTGQAHWHVLLQARAIENQAYVLAAAQGGMHDNGRRTFGHSLIVDPWGDLLACQRADGPGVVMATLSRQRLAQVRRQLPALQHRVL